MFLFSLVLIFVFLVDLAMLSDRVGDRVAIFLFWNGNREAIK